LKNYEKESFLKTFGIFFITLVILCFVIFFFYYEESRDHIKEDLRYQMKEYAFDFKGKKFSLDFIKKKKGVKFSEISTCKEGLCSYYPIPKDDKYVLKIIYNQKSFDNDIDNLKLRLIKIMILVLFVIFLFSLYFAIYSLKPMKNAIELLEVFLKDLIHDLNTPVTSILLNVKLLERRESSAELERIESSANTISSLHQNLEILQNNERRERTTLDLQNLINKRVEILQKIYPKITFIKKLDSLHVDSNEDALLRIIDNILTNACKYNKKNGEIIISISNKTISIRDTGIGIKNTKRVMDRYYKENERGLGLGLDIVKRLCDELKIDIKIESEINKGTIVKLTFN